VRRRIAVTASTAQLIDFGVYDQRLEALNVMTHNSVFAVVSLASSVTAASSSPSRSS
jgi:hypothetical protein